MRYMITGTVAGGENAGMRVAIYWSPEGGGWWQWAPGPGYVFDITGKDTNDRFKDAINTAYGNTWCGGPGPYYYRVDPTTVRIEKAL